MEVLWQFRDKILRFKDLRSDIDSAVSRVWPTFGKLGTQTNIR